MGAVATGTPPDRAALARSVLRRAEERTGASRFAPVPPRGGGGSAPALAGPSPAADEAVPDGALGTVPGGVPTGSVPAAAVDPEASARLLPVPAGLGALLPEGALRRGSTVVVAGSTSLALGLLADVSRAGGWVALVGLPEVGVLAAHQLGLDLDRVALVPAPGPEAPIAVAALLDGVDVVVVGPAAALTDADRRRLSARARERSAVLLPTVPWPGAHVALTAERSRWDGLGQGSGRLRSRALTVRRQGRGAAGRATVLDVTVPATPHPWAEGSVPQPVADGSDREPGASWASGRRRAG